MKKAILVFILVVIFMGAVSCTKIEDDIISSDNTSDVTQPQSVTLSLEEKVKRLNSSEYVPILENPTKDFISEEDARVHSKELLLQYLSDELKAAIDYDFDTDALAASVFTANLWGSNEAAMWEVIFLLPDSPDHLEVAIFTDAETGSLLRVTFQGKMFNIKDISETEQGQFLRAFEEVSGYATVQDVSTSDESYYFRQMNYETDTLLYIKIYIDNGYFTIAYT